MKNLSLKNKNTQNNSNDKFKMFSNKITKTNTEKQGSIKYIFLGQKEANKMR